MEKPAANPYYIQNISVTCDLRKGQMAKSKRHNIKLLPPSFSAWQPAGPVSRQIAVLMSGGVDSSLTAHLLRSQGWEVLGITMKILVSCETVMRGCCGAEAAFVCDELKIPHYFVDVTEAFEELIIQRFRQSYAKGQTPNPCADCNTYLKFSLLWELVEQEFGIRHLATGHYAQIVKAGGEMYLGKAKDQTKDQSYFLYGIGAEKFSRLMFPLGEMTKDKVRSTAAQLNLSVAEKAESMELCFAGEGDYRRVLAENQVNNAGDITDMDGNRIGTHQGIANYTLGQRRGIGFAGGKPLYVSKIDARTNTIALGTREQVCCQVVRADNINVLIPQQFAAGRRCFGKIRSYTQANRCKIISAESDKMTVEFDQPQFAPSAGQKLVLYNEDNFIIAGGTIV